VKIGAIISVSDPVEDLSAAPGESTAIGAMESCRLDILGESLLDRTLDKLHRFGVDQCSIISAEDASQELISPSRKTAPADFSPSWEQAVAGYIRAGIDRLLLLRLRAYTDLDYVELLQFHKQTGAPLTHAYGEDGALDVALVDASHLRYLDLQTFDLQNSEACYRAYVSKLIPQQHQFRYRGYINRLATPQDWYSLVHDGLHGRCGLIPRGRQTGDHIWQADDCALDETVRVTGPAFIGAGTHVAAYAVIASGTAIERDCEIDCGTTVQRSWIHQNTYVGVALDVRRSLVANGVLFNLERNVRVNIGEARLLGAATRSTSFLEGLGSFIWDSNAR
jgi:NDP-sugar pyrophosphorylase family protein